MFLNSVALGVQRLPYIGYSELLFVIRLKHGEFRIYPIMRNTGARR